MFKSYDIIIYSPCKNIMIYFKHSHPILLCNLRTTSYKVTSCLIKISAYLEYPLSWFKTVIRQYAVTLWNILYLLRKWLCNTCLCIYVVKDTINLLTYVINLAVHLLHNFKWLLYLFIPFTKAYGSLIHCFCKLIYIIS